MWCHKHILILNGEEEVEDIIKEDCDPADAQDKSLPTNAFLVEYRVDDASHYDLVFASKQVDIFDHYYDQYKKNLSP